MPKGSLRVKVGAPVRPASPVSVPEPPVEAGEAAKLEAVLKLARAPLTEELDDDGR